MTMTTMMIERGERRVSPRAIYRDLIDTTATTTNNNDVMRARVFRYFLYTQCTLERARAGTIIKKRLFYLVVNLFSLLSCFKNSPPGC